MGRRKPIQKKTIYAFIDSQNLNLGIRDQGWRLDFVRFSTYLKEKYQVKKAFLFIGYIPKYRKLYNRLKKAGYFLVFKPILIIKNKRKPRTENRIKGNVDAELVLHAMIEYPNYNKAIIVTGDGDFHCLVEYLLGKKKLGRLIVPNQKKYSKLFQKFRKHIDFMNNLRPKLSLKA